MSQLTFQTPVPGSNTPGGRRRRPMRSERMVGLRSAMPLGLVTLRHDVPEYLTEATPKVDTAERVERAGIETPARKGGEAQW
jgi:hypothetical protein